MVDTIVKRSDPKSNVILGIDFGDTNIGVAFARAGLASPLDIVNGKNQVEAASTIAKIAIENGATKIVVGLPLTYDNKETKKSHEVRRFTKLLKSYVKVPIEYVNEYLTTQDAIKDAIDTGLSMRARKKVDSLSAAIILNKYLEQIS